MTSMETPTTLAEALEMIEQLTQQLNERDKLLAKQSDQLDRVSKQLENLSEQHKALLAMFRSQNFGKKSEKLTPGQLELDFGLDEPKDREENQDSSSEQPQARHSKKRTTSKPKKNWAETLDHLPQVDKEYHLTEGEKQCPHCHKKMRYCGKKVVSRSVEVIPRRAYCKNVWTETYQCQHCPAHGSEKVMVSSKAPRSLFPHSYFSPSVLADVLYSKFVLALPFYRQAESWKRIKIPIAAKHMSTAVIKSADRIIRPLYELIRQTLVNSPLIQADESPLLVLESEKAKDYIWAFRTPVKFGKQPLVFYYHDESGTRSGSVLADVLGKDFSGQIQCDGFNGYSLKYLPNAIFGSCLVHADRKFKQILDTLSAAKKSMAKEVVKMMAVIFHQENNFEFQTAEERRQLRIKHIKPLMDKLFEYLVEQQAMAGGKLLEAINYALKRKERIYQIFEDGELPLDNNDLEQCIRKHTVIRKNCEFANTIAGAEAHAMWMTITQSAKLNGLDVREYLEVILRASTLPDKPDWEAYLPWNYKQKQEKVA